MRPFGPSQQITRQPAWLPAWLPQTHPLPSPLPPALPRSFLGLDPSQPPVADLPLGAGEEQQGWPIKRQQIEELVKLVKADAERWDPLCLQDQRIVLGCRRGAWWRAWALLRPCCLPPHHTAPPPPPSSLATQHL